MQAVVTKSPFEDLIPTPDFVTQISDYIYFPSKAISTFLDRPEGKLYKAYAS